MKHVNLNPKLHILTWGGSALVFSSQWKSAPHAVQVTQHVPNKIALYSIFFNCEVFVLAGVFK